MKETTLICIFCDPPGGFNKGKHTQEHMLLSVRSKSEEKNEDDKDKKVLDTISGLETKVDSKLSEMEATLHSLDDRIGAVDGLLTDRMNAVDEKIDQKFQIMDEKFSRIERLLENLLSVHSRR
jgi:hypothetical protein